MEIQQQTERYIYEVEETSALDFDKLFKNFSEMLYNYAFYYLNDMEAAKSVVNDTFLRLWDGKRKPLYIKPYLYRSVKNACLNYLSQRKDNVVFKESFELENLSDGFVNVHHNEDTIDKLLFLEKVISNLPAKRQLVFKMFRFEELSYAEIAELLNISVRTVEDHLAKSMQFIHAQAKHLVDGKLTNT
ncbi:sigma-70 family RNA polymerase sigma factor [Pedobacter xixiisoli]|uniref:RNA polymerase sigma-70 factor, ECF subfamily n=1 Tax=Pedobacter xixiisoli TaxID=1476464 RepID=A0A285ZT59_9SPHI|nr:sigma-70 family RNA polymerase sigma factor [Pedobacter xixiisoli]SOD12828.1 RNA polymerase sigma-70 factor, ECF subfamily [Pedobacter xixiisoli]